MLPLLIPARVATQNESLRYCLRAWERAEQQLAATILPVIVGHIPMWYRGEFVKTDQERLSNDVQWRVNFRLALQAAIDWARQPDFFRVKQQNQEWILWSADDIFPLDLEPLQGLGLEKWPTYARIMNLHEYIAAWGKVLRNDTYGRHFQQGMEGQQKIIRDLAPGITYNADTHLPHALDVSKLDELLNDIIPNKYPEHPKGQFRAVYGALYPGPTVRRVQDPKVAGLTSLPQGRLADGTEWVSTSNSSWRGRTGNLLRELLPNRSRWEAPDGPIPQP